MNELTDEQKAILDFEGAGWWKYAGAKETAVREQLGIGATVYYQKLNHVIDLPEALAYAPMTVKRARRLRDGRRRQRSERTLEQQS